MSRHESFGVEAEIRFQFHDVAAFLFYLPMRLGEAIVMNRPVKKSSNLEIRLTHTKKEAFMAACAENDVSASRALKAPGAGISGRHG